MQHWIATFNSSRPSDTLCDSKLSHLDPIGMKPSSELIAASNHFIKFESKYASYLIVFIFGTACQIYCCGQYCVSQSVSPKVPENPSGPLIDNFIVLPCVACGVACKKLLPGVDRWNSLDDLRVIGPCHCEVWGWPRHQADFDWFFGRPILETSLRGASFRVTHTANRKC